MEEGYKEERVGYGRPPRETQFMKGKSGNPKGRPKHPTTPRECINKIFSEYRTVTVDGKRKKITKLELFFRLMCTESLKGNMKAADMLLKHFGDSINIYGELYPPEIRSEEENQRANEIIDMLKGLVSEKRRDGS